MHFQYGTYILKLTPVRRYETDITYSLRRRFNDDHDQVTVSGSAYIYLFIYFFFFANLMSNQLCPLGSTLSFPEGKVTGRKAGHTFPSNARYERVLISP